ncbi:MAG: hypothetical protein RML35_12495 [Chloroherpetonaceae bacterium]|nr:hypothetical protein [Chloroherpetonaceae bacterium]MDW8466951.1 hypothetical protein [Chloroherpetonaceae bacterium]
MGCSPAAHLRTTQFAQPVAASSAAANSYPSSSGSADSTAAPLSTSSDEVKAPNRTSLIIIAVGAVALVIATPIIISRIGGRGGEDSGKQDDKTGISSTLPVPGY